LPMHGRSQIFAERSKACLSRLNLPPPAPRLSLPTKFVIVCRTAFDFSPVGAVGTRLYDPQSTGVTSRFQRTNARFSGDCRFSLVVLICGRRRQSGRVPIHSITSSNLSTNR